MKSKLLVSLVVTLAGLLNGCGAIQTRSKDDAAVGRIKKVAVVAFAVAEPASAKIGLSNGKLGAAAGGSMIAQNDPSVDAMYEQLCKSVKEKMNWNIMDQKLMTSNKGYREAFNNTMKGFQNKMPVGQGMTQFLVTDVMDYDSPRILNVAGRDALIQALGVDAIVVARVDVALNGTTVMGIGSRHPQSNLSFSIYRKGDVKPVWFEGGIHGEEMPESLGKTGYIDEALLQKLALKSVQTAYAKIGASEVR